MGFPLLKLMDMTGPLGFPTDIAMAEVIDQERFQVARMHLEPNDELERTLFEFDDQSFVPFQNPLQLRLLLNGPGAAFLGETIIDAGDAGQGEKNIRFNPTGPSGPFYELTYKVLPAN